MPPAPLLPPESRSAFYLLIIDRGPHIDALAHQFTSQGIQVTVCEDPAEALLEAGNLKPDAVLAAANLHTVDSATLTGILRRRLDIPVLLGIADGEGDTAAAALSAGASACVARPYRFHEVFAILNAIRADAEPSDTPPLEVGGLRLDPNTLEAILHGRAIRLPEREFRLLWLLLANAGRVVSRDRIRMQLWQNSPPDASNTITVHIRRLRARFGDDPLNPSMIVTVRRRGYRIIPPAPQPPTNG